MTLGVADKRSARRVGVGILAGALFLAIAGAIMLPGRASRSRQLMRAACQKRYAQARTRGDSLIAGGWIPRPDLQVRRQYLTCRDLGYP